MKVVILAGGRGTRLSEETGVKPKPMVEVGGKPILWHIMKIYSSYGFNDFVVCLGYMGNVIKDYFLNYINRNYNFSIRLDTGAVNHHSIKDSIDPWNVLLYDTGLDSGTAERVIAVEPYLDDIFMLTYGDGVADIDVDRLFEYHKSHGKLATMSVAQPDNKLGIVTVDKTGMVTNFREKPPNDGWSNCGFFVFDKRALGFFRQSRNIEGEPLVMLLKNRQLMAYEHSGYWACMDTYREKLILEEQWRSGAPWKVW